jgi:hypothetical protein
MRRAHLIVGLVGILAFVLTGQVMSHHHPKVAELPAEFRMMYVSRHIYLLSAALVNAVLGLYLHLQPAGWRRFLQGIGCALVLISPLVLLIAFLQEPGLGILGRSWRGYLGLIGLFAGVIAHIVAAAGAPRIDTKPSRL